MVARCCALFVAVCGYLMFGVCCLLCAVCCKLLLLVADSLGFAARCVLFVVCGLFFEC